MNKSTLIDELRNITCLNQFEIEKIYNAFAKITSLRAANRNDGTVNFIEFLSIMK